MSLNLSKSPLLATIVIVGLIAGTAPIAGYVDRPGAESPAVAAADKCDSCPREGTQDCCKVTGVCAEAARNGGDASTCASGGACAGEAACPAGAAKATAGKTCPSAQAACPNAAAAAEGGCGAGGPCTRAQ